MNLRLRRLLERKTAQVGARRREALLGAFGLAGLGSAQAAAAAEADLPARPGGHLDVTRLGAVPGTLDRPGRDSTTAIQQAIDTVSAEGGGSVLLPPGVFWVTGLTMAPRVTLTGTGWGSVLKLLPDSNQHVLRSSANRVSPDGGCTDEMYAVTNLAIDGNRYAQRWDWWGDGIHFDMTFNNRAIPTAPTNIWQLNDHCHHFSRLFIKECKRDGIFLRGKGGHTGSHIHIGSCSRFGMLINSYDNLWSHVYVGGTGSDGIRLRTGPNHFTCAKTFFTGQDTQWATNGKVAGEGVSPEDWRYGAGWVIHNGGTVLSSCEAQDSWSHGIMLVGSQITLNGVRLANIGSLGRHFGMGRQPGAEDAAAIWLGPEASHNIVNGSIGDQFVQFEGKGPNTRFAVTCSKGASGNRIQLKAAPGTISAAMGPDVADVAADGNDVRVD